MQPSQENNKNGEVSNSNEERVQRIDSEIKLKKQQLVEGLENSSPDDSRRRRPNFPLSKTKKPAGSQRTPPEFYPFLTNTLEIPEKSSFYYGTNFYCEKYNMIIVCPLSKIVHFYDATTLLPLEERKALEIDGPVLHISFCEATDICLFACLWGDIYAYDLSNHILTKLQKYGESLVPAIAFINPAWYAFSAFKSKQVFIGNLAEGSLLSFDSNELDPSSISKPEKRNLLFSGLTDGSMIVYRTDRLPKLPVLCSERNKKSGVMRIENVIINGKEFIITAENDGFIRLRHFIKGNLRLVKVIRTEERVYWWIYLKKYNMIATTHEKEYVKFWSLPSGKLVYTYSSSQIHFKNIFLMKDKDMIGVASSDKNIIEIVQLSGFKGIV